MKKISILLLVFSLFIVLSFSVSISAEEHKYGGTFTISVMYSPPSLDPANMEHGEEYIFVEAVYNRLTRLNPDFSVDPELAKDWDVNEEATEFIFYLRDDVYYHDDTKMTADDVKAVFDRHLDPEVGSFLRDILEPVEKVNVIDDYTVKFELSSGFADLPVILADPKAAIYPEHNVDNLTTDPIGSGPFEFEEFIEGERLEFTRNEDYWQEGLPYLERIVQRIQPDPVTAMNSLITGDIDVIWNTRIEYAEVFEGHPEISWKETPSPGFNNIYMMVTEDPFDNNLVRKALKYTIDREEFVDAALGGHGVVGNDHPVPPFHEYYNDDIPIREQDYDKARELLAEAGYEDGLELTLYTSESRWGQLESAIVLEEMAGPAGIDIEIVNLDGATFWSDYWQVEPFLVSNWFGRATIHQTLYPYFHSEGGWNYANYENEKVDDLLEKGMAEADENKRKEIYHEIQEILYEEGPWLLPYFKTYPVATRKTVQDYPHYPNQWVNFHEVWLDN